MATQLTADELAFAADMDGRYGHIPEAGGYYDRTGSRISFGTWGALRSMRPEYLHIGSTPVADMWVSTVWLGLDHSFWPDGPPILFETMIFQLGGSSVWDGVRYSTEEQARSGHERACYLAMRAGLASRLAAMPWDAISSRSLGPCPGR